MKIIQRSAWASSFQLLTFLDYLRGLTLFIWTLLMGRSRSGCGTRTWCKVTIIMPPRCMAIFRTWLGIARTWMFRLRGWTRRKDGLTFLTCQIPSVPVLKSTSFLKEALLNSSLFLQLCIRSGFKRSWAWLRDLLQCHPFIALAITLVNMRRRRLRLWCSGTQTSTPIDIQLTCSGWISTMRKTLCTSSSTRRISRWVLFPSWTCKLRMINVT